MPTCHACAAPTPEGARFCPLCAAALPGERLVTGQAGDARSAVDETVLPAATGTRPSAAPIQTETPHVYTAGTMLAQRYRIVGLLGRGGMGEVYRADDLTLGQPVALKFVPRELAGDSRRFARFLDEARTARQVAHGNVCRVYDVGETDDPSGRATARRFLTMEYVDGEDLASSLRRIGHFPADKGLEIARQLCAGLAAVHERGLLHRDLKPANVMLDGRGRVRLTDFGLAGEADPADRPAGEVSGTPGYMAPELLRGEPSSIASDIYALGLVLYEVFTGRRAFDAATMADLRTQQEQVRPVALSSSVGHVDPAIEEVVFRCLDPNPSRRPASAVAVAAALPGGDPLAAALAAGETPSPAMVAAAGENQGLPARTAVALLVGFFFLLAVVIGFIAYAGFLRQVPFDRPPEVLASKAEDVLRTSGFEGKPVDRAFFFYWHTDYTRFVETQRQGRDRWAPMRSGIEPGVLFFYRASDLPMVPTNLSSGDQLGRVGTSDPPPIRAGDRRVWLDTAGRLSRLEIVPPQVDDAPADPGGVKAPDWRPLFAAAGLDPARFVEARPEWVPLAGFDARLAWTGTMAERPDTPLRVEGAWWRGRPVFFRVIAPWTRPERQRAADVSVGQRVANAVGIVVFLGLLAGAVLLARYNAAQGRADLRGATRLAAFIAALSMAGWVLSADHVLTTDELQLVLVGVSAALVTAAAAWVLYVALEPFVRRRWPHTVITWNRLLAGRFRDGLFGRDLLVGAVIGLWLAVLFFVHLLLGRMIGPSEPEPLTPVLTPLLGTRYVGAAFVALLSSSIIASLQIFGLAFLGLLIMRRVWAATLALLVLAALQSSGGIHPAIGMGYRVLMMGSLLYVLFRYGLVAFAVTGFVLSTVGGGFPLSVDPSHWSTGASIVVLVGLSAAAVFGFRLALGSQKILGGALDG